MSTAAEFRSQPIGESIESAAGRARRRWFALAAALTVLLVLELLSHLAMAVLARDPRFDFTKVRDREAKLVHGLGELLRVQGRALVQLDEELGWVYAPNFRNELYTSNSLGHRSVREYAATPPPGVLRITAFGDSFVHCNEVTDEQCWSARAEARDERLEVLNHGVGGYGTDQALLYYARRGDELGASVALLGFVEVDYARNLNRFRRFLAVNEMPLFKPRFLAGPNRELELVPNPFPGVDRLRPLLDDPTLARGAAEHDWFYQPLVWQNPLYDHVGLVRLASTVASDAWRAKLRPDGLYRGDQLNPDSEAFDVLLAIVERFTALARERGQHPVLMIFPGRASDIWGSAPRTYQPLLDGLAPLASDLHVLDLADALARDPAVTEQNLLLPLQHLGPEANEAAARAVHELALAQGWLAAAD